MRSDQLLPNRKIYSPHLCNFYKFTVCPTAAKPTEKEYKTNVYGVQFTSIYISIL